MHSTTNYLIVNLALADILFVVLCAPYTAFEYSSTVWPFGDTVCKVSQYMIYVTLHGSVYTLVLMAVDRFIAVVYPVSGMSFRTDRNTIAAIVFLWIFSFLGLIPVIFRFEENAYVHVGVNKSTCMLVESHRGNLILTVSLLDLFFLFFKWWRKLLFQSVMFVTSYALPLLLILFLYGGMLTRLWRNVPGRRTAGETRVRATRMVTIVIASFILLWTPTHVSVF